MQHLTIRPARPEDIHFILHSWLKRYRDAIRARFIPDKVYYSVQHDVITKIFSQTGLVIRVAVNPEDENQIYGYVVAEVSPLLPQVKFLHWIYVKGPFRRFGVAKALLASLPDLEHVHYTHRTRWVDDLNKENTWLHNPHYVWSLFCD